MATFLHQQRCLVHQLECLLCRPNSSQTSRRLSEGVKTSFGYLLVPCFRFRRFVSRPAVQEWRHEHRGRKDGEWQRDGRRSAAVLRIFLSEQFNISSPQFIQSLCLWMVDTVTDWLTPHNFTNVPFTLRRRCVRLKGTWLQGLESNRRSSDRTTTRFYPRSLYFIVTVIISAFHSKTSVVRSKSCN